MQLAYKRYGAGHPLIILHGLLGAGGNWHTLSNKVFGEQAEVFTLDQRNHGRSPHSPMFDYPSMVTDLEMFMTDHDLASATVMGHSMGGKTAMHVALTHPTRVDALIVVDMAPRAYPPHHAEILDALRALDLTTYTARQDIDAALARRIASYPVRQFLLQNLSYDRATGYSWRMNLDGIYQNYERLNGAITADASYDRPALFIRGERSDYITDADEPLIKTFFPRAELVTIAGAGHWVHAEAPDAFANAVVDFLRDVGRKR